MNKYKHLDVFMHDRIKLPHGKALRTVEEIQSIVHEELLHHAAFP